MIMTFIRAHRMAIVLAIFAGIISVAPSILAPLSLGSGYHGVQYLQLDDEDIYRARIHEVLDGYPTVASPMLYEYKSAPTPYTPVNEWLYALPAFIFGLSAVVLASKFLLPAALFFLVYLLVRRIIREDGSAAEATALAAGLLVALGSDFVDYGYLLSLAHGAAPRPLLWTRLVDPISGGVELFGFLLLLIYVRRGKWRYYVSVAAGAVLALMVGYFFAYGMALAVLGALFLFALVRKEFGAAKMLALVGITSLILDAPWWYGMLRSYAGAGATRAAAERAGMFFTHAPVLNKELLAATALLAALWALDRFALRTRADSRIWVFPAVFIAGCWIAFNEQVVTGREIWYYHFAQYTVPLSIIALLVAGYFVLARFSVRWWTAAMYGLCALSLVYGAYSITSYVSRMPDLVRQQTYAPLFDWLNMNAQKDCVVLLAQYNEELERYIPAYTQCNVYSTTYTFSGIPMERIQHNYFIRLRLAGVTADAVDAYLHAHEDDVRGYFYRDWTDLFGHGDAPWLEADIADLSAQYRTFLQGNFADEIHTYRIDYLVTTGPVSPTLVRALGLHAPITAGPYELYSL